MKNKLSLILTFALISLLLIPSVALASDLDAWMRQHGVGPYAPEMEDWDAVYEAAKKEGKVVIYSNSSRIFDAAQSFEAAYPGITVEAFNLSNPEIVTKIEREAEAKIIYADAILASGLMNLAHEMLEKELIVNYIPPELKSVIPESLQEPLLTHRLSPVVLAWSDLAFDEQPFESLWELTLPKWKNRIVTRDPLRSAGTMNLLTSFVEFADELEADYERMFGEPIQLTTPNAGYELIKRLLDNGLQLETGSRQVLERVNNSDPNTSVIGQISAGKYRDVLDGTYSFKIAWDVTPFAGYSSETKLPMIARARHPNAAKLLIKWLMGDEFGGQGMAPWYNPGDFPIRDDVQSPEPFGHHTEYNLRYENADNRNDLKNEVMDFWIMHL